MHGILGFWELCGYFHSNVICLMKINRLDHVLHNCISHLKVFMISLSDFIFVNRNQDSSLNLQTTSTNTSYLTLFFVCGSILVYSTNYIKITPSKRSQEKKSISMWKERKVFLAKNEENKNLTKVGMQLGQLKFKHPQMFRQKYDH